MAQSLSACRLVVATFFALSACKQGSNSELLSDPDNAPKGPCEANPSSDDDNKTVPQSSAAFSGCTVEVLDGEALDVEGSLNVVDGEIKKLEEAVGATLSDDARITQLERDIQSMQGRLQRLREAREQRQSGRPAITNVCVDVRTETNKVVSCAANSNANVCAGEHGGVKKVFFGEGSCSYFRTDSTYTGATGGACLSIMTVDSKVSSCAYGTTREACEGGAGNPGYRYIFREQSCDAFRSGTVFSGTASVAGGSGNGGSNNGTNNNGNNNGSNNGGTTQATAYQERCVREGGFPDGNMCQCDEAGWQLAESAFNHLKPGDCKVTVKGICKIVRGQIQSDGGCRCGSTRYDVSAFRIGEVCNQGGQSPGQNPWPIPSNPSNPSSPGISPVSPNPSTNPSLGQPPSACTVRRKAVLVVTVPRSDSRITISGQNTTSTGTTRSFDTPELCTDRVYKYRISVDGAAVVEATVQGGGTTRCTIPGSGCGRPQ